MQQALSFWLLAWGVSEKSPALFNSTKKQRLLRCLTLEYTTHKAFLRFRALHSVSFSEFSSTLDLSDASWSCFATRPCRLLGLAGEGLQDFEQAGLDGLVLEVLQATVLAFDHLGAQRFVLHKVVDCEGGAHRVVIRQEHAGAV